MKLWLLSILVLAATVCAAGAVLLIVTLLAGLSHGWLIGALLVGGVVLIRYTAL